MDQNVNLNKQEFIDLGALSWDIRYNILGRTPRGEVNSLLAWLLESDG